MGSAGKSKYKFTVGQQIGKWTVLSETLVGSPAKVQLKCACGTEKLVDVYSLINNRSTNCGCERKVKKSGVTKTTLYRALVKLKRHNSSIDITDLEQLRGHQSNSCAISGEILNNSSTISRIDSTKGYVSDNILWVNSSVSPIANAYGIIGAQNALNSIPKVYNVFEQMGFKKGD